MSTTSDAAGHAPAAAAPTTGPSSPYATAPASPDSPGRSAAGGRRSEESLRPPRMPYAPDRDLQHSPSVNSLASSQPSTFSSQRQLYHAADNMSSTGDTLNSKPSQTPLADWGAADSAAYSNGGGRSQPATAEKHDDDDQHPPPPAFKPANRFGGGGGRDWRFWMVFLSILLATFIAALDMTAISTAAPVIVNALNGKEFTWIGSSYGLTSTAFLPWSGGLATIFGRRAILVSSIIIFAIGSALCGASQTMTMLIASRAVQGVGCGGILSLSEIIIGDLVPLKERGIFLGYLGATWAIASALGPPIGGALSEHATWRWLFYMNVPLSAVSLAFVCLFMNLKVPQETLREKLKKMDWVGNALLIGSSTSTILALTWGGVTYGWGSWRVIVPLAVGVSGLAFSFWFQANHVKEPTVPFELLSNRSALSGYIATFFHAIIVVAQVFYLPVFFQAVLGTGPTDSGINLFPTVFTIAAFAIACGLSITISQTYRIQNYVGWLLATGGMGVMSLMDVNSPKRDWIGFQIVVSVGMGILYAAPQFPILASLPTSKTAHALSFFTFVRTFGQVWGVTIGSTVLQNELGKRLPADYLAQFPEGLEIVYAVIPTIKNIQDPVLKAEVMKAFADSLQLLWRICIPISGAGLIASLLMKGIPLHSKVDAEFGYRPTASPLSNGSQSGSRKSGSNSAGDEEHALEVHTVPYGSVNNGLSSPNLGREKEWDAPQPHSDYVHYSPAANAASQSQRT